ISVVIGRVPNNPPLCCVYFFPAYFLGIVISMNYDKFVAVPTNIIWSFLYLTIGLMAILSATGYWGEVVRFTRFTPFKNLSCVAIVKLCVCILYLYLFIWLKKRNFPIIKKILKILAKYSFTIFFFQQFALSWLYAHPHKEFFIALHLNFWGFLAFSFFASVLVCIMIIALFSPIKYLLGKYSRMIIGC
ncbi:hypothetical protein, partial [Desulfovibrio sp.]|uniref:hypothetical protein n=1 Tax=Desulfovibrio sp. TaxID=885 RepID=UPI0023CBEB69